MASCLYRQLRNAVANLGADAARQVAYLDSILGHLSENGDASGFGNDELGLEFENGLVGLETLIMDGELTRDQAVHLKPLDDLLLRWSGQEHADFWRRAALFDDPRWAEVRTLARIALAHLPLDLEGI